MRLKDSTVSIKGFKPELVLALFIIDQVMKEQGQEAVIANTKISSFWRAIVKYGSKILIGILTTMGAIIAYAVFG